MVIDHNYFNNFITYFDHFIKQIIFFVLGTCSEYKPYPRGKWDPVHIHFQNTCPMFQQKPETEKRLSLMIVLLEKQY